MFENPDPRGMTQRLANSRKGNDVHLAGPGERISRIWKSLYHTDSLFIVYLRYTINWRTSSEKIRQVEGEDDNAFG
jgi:hypothetical protein